MKIDAFKAVKISDRIYWVGAIDWGLRNFHGYLTARGTTYNAFLVMADEVALIDTVKPAFYDEMMARIADVVAGAGIVRQDRHAWTDDRSGADRDQPAEAGIDQRPAPGVDPALDLEPLLLERFEIGLAAYASTPLPRFTPEASDLQRVEEPRHDDP